MRDPAVLFYTQDFLTGCTDLTFEERGQYITMLCLQHQKGHLSKKTISLTLGSVSVDVLRKFSQDEKGNYYNERMEGEMQKRAQFIETRRDNGRKGGRPKKSTSLANGKAKNNLPEDENISYVLLFNKVIKENDINLSEEFKELILEWLKYKSEKRQTYKETGLKSLLIKVMQDTGGDVEELRNMILYSTSKNYDGLFKEKNNAGHKKDNGATPDEIAAIVAGKFASDRA